MDSELPFCVRMVVCRSGDIQGTSRVLCLGSAGSRGDSVLSGVSFCLASEKTSQPPPRWCRHCRHIVSPSSMNPGESGKQESVHRALWTGVINAGRTLLPQEIYPQSHESQIL